jgi:hypothetical protein
MIGTWYRRLATAKSRRSFRSRPLAARRPSFPPKLEQLEPRLTPDTYTWTGANSGLWSDPGNWLSSPTPGQTPVGDPSADLVFPDIDGQRATRDDIPGPVYVRSITFNVNGDSSLVGDNGAFLVFLPGTITVNNYVTAFINLDIDLNNNGIFIGHYISVGTGGNLELGGLIHGSPLSNLTKSGPGTLTVSPSSSGNDYEGHTFIDAGDLEAIGNRALPQFTAVSVASGATLAFLGDLVPEPMSSFPK